jgi:zinc/manganese transport system substrate-binding protein
MPTPIEGFFLVLFGRCVFDLGDPSGVAADRRPLPMFTTASVDRSHVPVPECRVKQIIASSCSILAEQRRLGATRFAWKVGVLAFVALLPAACGSQSSSTATAASTAPINVVASTNVWGDIAEQIGGDRVAVTSILSDPSADPHAYESDATTAAAISRSQIVIENGFGYDDFMDKLLAASPNASRKAVDAADVIGMSGADANPHVWYDIARVPDVATAIADQLGAIDPAGAATFMANASTFTASLAPINAAIAKIKDKYPGGRVGYTERVAGYLVEAAGLVLGTPASFAQSIEDGNDPSVADTSAMNAALTNKTIKVLLYNGQVTSPGTDAVKKLAQENGIPVVGVTETIPKGDNDFQAWQLRQITDITTALGG